MLSKSELDAILAKIDLEGFKQEVKVKNETRGRKPKVVINYWRESLVDASYSDLNPWVDDVLTGAGRLSTGNSKVSGEFIFALLRGVPTITTPEIKSFINRKRVISGDYINDDSYCQWLARCMVSAMKSLDYHIERGKKISKPFVLDENFDVKQDALMYEQYGKDWNNYGLGI